DPTYLGQNLNERTRKATHDFAVEMTEIIASKVNALNGSRTFVQFGQAGLKIFERDAIEACKFVYNLTGQHTGEPYNQLEFCIGRMVKNMVSAMNEKAAQSAVGGADIVNRVRDEMESKRDHLLADFKNGMMGSERLKKDPVVSIVANQTNSPGGIQQVGVGD